MKKFLRLPALAVFLALTLSGCWHVPLSAIWRLREIDSSQVDPARLRLAARVPQWLEATPGSAKVRLTVQRGSEPDRVFELILEERGESADLAALAPESRPGAHFLVFRASAADVALLRGLQAEARAAKAADPSRKGGGSIALEAKACSRNPPPEGPIMIDLYLSVGDKGGFFKIYEDVDLRELHKPESRPEEVVPPCGKWSGRAS